jgi:GNAT superfamily N-acetyltransferase
MNRQVLTLRDAGPDDAAQLVELWAEAGQQAGEGSPHAVADAAAALAHVAADADQRLVVGEHEGVVVAAIHLARRPISPLQTEHIIHTSYLMVHPHFRRHGYARALLEAAVAWAEEKDVRHVSAIATSSGRDTNRFLARLGLGTVATVRVSTTSALRKKLLPERVVRAGVNRHLGEVLAQRRSMRRREAGS